MKGFILLLSLISVTAYSQVGIGTDSPTATLDVNGDLRIRAIDHETDEDIIRDSILVISKQGIVRRIEAEDIIKSVFKSAVKGRFSSSSTVSLSLTSNLAIMPFNSVDWDLNNEFDTTTFTFTAKQDGIYSLFAQLKASPTISITGNFGISVYKNNVLESTNSFANVGVVGVNITPPVRAVYTLVGLSTGDEITFKVTSTLSNLSIIGSSTESYFTIHQIR